MCNFEEPKEPYEGSGSDTDPDGVGHYCRRLHPGHGTPDSDGSFGDVFQPGDQYLSRGNWYDIPEQMYDWRVPERWTVRRPQMIEEISSILGPYARYEFHRDDEIIMRLGDFTERAFRCYERIEAAQILRRRYDSASIANGRPGFRPS